MATKLLDCQLSQAREMLANGESLTAISKRIGCDRSTIRKYLDAEYLAVRTAQLAKADATRKRNRAANRVAKKAARKTVNGIGGTVVRSLSRPDPEEAARLLALIPADTRSLTGRICGDPLPGRSALCRRQAETAL